MLVAKGVSQKIIENSLQVVQGDARDLETVKKVLFYQDQPVSKILSGIGMTPTLNPKNMDGTICQDVTKNILQALRELKFEKKAYLAAISTTGISEGAEDVPFLLRPLYHWLLAIPHSDKRVVDQLIVEAAREGKTISGYTVVRPSLLVNGKAKGMEKIRVGSEKEPAIGYTIRRDDVGLWMFEELIKGDGMKWNGVKPSITY